MRIIKEQNGAFQTAESIFLDFTRFLLSLAVVISHISQSAFKSSFESELTSMGVLAVGGFFVLSGYTIRALIQKNHNEFNFPEYIAERFSRLLSISAPALIITVIADLLSYSLNTAFYLEHWGSSLGQAPLRVAMNLIFFSQPYGYSVAPLSNSPFWSLSYEAGFYLIFGSGLFVLKNKKMYWLPLAVMLLYGPNISIMFLAWCSGTLLHKITSKPNQGKKIVLCASITIALLAIEYLATLKKVQSPINIALEILPLLHVPYGRVTSNLFIGALLYLAVQFPALFLIRVDSNKIVKTPGVQNFSRKLGEATFPLYLTHFPLLVLMKASGLWPDHNIMADAIAITAVLTVSYYLIRPGNKLKKIIQAMMLHVFSIAQQRKSAI